MQSNQAPATETDFTAPGLETANFATTDVDPSPESPRSLSAVEPNFATTDVDPTPERPRSLSTAKNVVTTDIEPTPGSAQPGDTETHCHGADVAAAHDVGRSGTGRSQRETDGP